jgi:hypothetical protein
VDLRTGNRFLENHGKNDVVYVGDDGMTSRWLSHALSKSPTTRNPKLKVQLVVDHWCMSLEHVHPTRAMTVMVGKTWEAFAMRLDCVSPDRLRGTATNGESRDMMSMHYMRADLAGTS